MSRVFDLNLQISACKLQFIGYEYYDLKVMLKRMYVSTTQ